MIKNLHIKHETETLFIEYATINTESKTANLEVSYAGYGAILANLSKIINDGEIIIPLDNEKLYDFLNDTYRKCNMNNCKVQIGELIFTVA